MHVQNGFSCGQENIFKNLNNRTMRWKILKICLNGSDIIQQEMNKLIMLEFFFFSSFFVYGERMCSQLVMTACFEDFLNLFWPCLKFKTVDLSPVLGGT